MATGQKCLLFRIPTIWAVFGCVAIGCVASASAQTTITYQYDDLGRLQEVQTGGTHTKTFSYDPAENRAMTTVTGSSDPSVPQTGTLLMVPLNQKYYPIPLPPICSPVAGCED